MNKNKYYYEARKIKKQNHRQKLLGDSLDNERDSKQTFEQLLKNDSLFRQAVIKVEWLKKLNNKVTPHSSFKEPNFNELSI